MSYVFGEYVLDTERHELSCAGEPIKLERKAYQVLVYLLQHHERLVTREELLEQVWPDTYVNDSAVARCIRTLRRALGDSRETQQMIQTLYGQGYRFVAAVEMGPRVRSESPPALTNAGDERCCPACQHANRATAHFCEVCGQRLDEDVPSIGRDIAYAPGPLVGREQALAMLTTWCEGAAQGQGHAVGIAGAPGIGKSRLLAALCHDLRDQPCTLLEVHCQPSWTMAPGLPLRGLIRQYCHITETDTVEVVTAKVSQHLQEAGIPPEERVDYILYLLGMRASGDRLAQVRPATIRVRMLATLRQMLLSRRLSTPLIIIIHGSHWLDDTSAMWLSSLVDSLADAPVLLLTTYRSGYQPPWIASPSSTEMALPPLSPQDSRRLVHALWPSPQLSDTLAQAILAQAQGNPLWLEVLTQFVAEHGEDRMHLTLPASLQEVMTVRLNRLPEPAKRLLQTAAVLGQHGTVSLLRRLWENPHDLQTQLAVVESQGFFTLQTESGASRFSFTHHLIHEAVYTSLQPLERQDLHAAAAQALEEQGTSHVEPTAHLLAWHHARSHGAAAAIRSLTHAAEQATGYFAHVEAVQSLQEAQALVPFLPSAEQPPCRLELLLRHAQSLVAVQRFQEVLDLLLPQQLLLSQVQDTSLVARHALLLSQACSGLGTWERVEEHAQHALEAATACRDETTLEQAYAILAMACYRSGRPLPGIDYSRQTIALHRGHAASSRLAMAQMVLGLNALLLGEIAMALEAASEADTLAATLGEPHLQTYAAWLLGWIHATRGASDAGIAACQRSLACAADPLNAAFASGWLGYAYLEQGDPAAAIPRLEQAVQQMHQWGYPRMEGLYTAFLAEALLAQEQFDMARDRAQQAFTQCQAATYAFGLGWAQRVLGRIAQATGALPVAWQHLADALATFAALPARFELGRTHLALALIARSEARRDPAVRHVTEAYQLFQTLHVERYVARAACLARALHLSFAPATDP
jgi:DNA-binding winged helix-turn-helix (wHTH) protein/tetratricopeptide (TPR) repeat protein